MIDLKKLNLDLVWETIARRYARGEHIERADLEIALESGEAMPPNLNPMILEIIRGERHLGKRGNKKLSTVLEAEDLERHHNVISDMVERFVVYMKDTTEIPHDWPHEIKAEIQQHARELKSKHRRKSGESEAKGPKERAYELVAKRFDISPSTIKNIAGGRY